MPTRYPPIEPYESGVLPVSDGHALYYECSGNPGGQPALYLHGGPGGGCGPGYRRYFDPEKWRIIAFDQRGCGRSRPLASAPDADLTTNTTAHLLADIEALRRHFGVEAWTVLGVSWGTTLALAYAHAHRDRVRGLVLALVTTTSRREVDWITEGAGRIFQEQWEKFAEAVPARFRRPRLVDAYAEWLAEPDPAEHAAAARAWCAWEDAHVSLSPGHVPSAAFEDPAFCLCFARLVTHYWRHAAFLAGGVLLRDAHRLNGIPGVLIHGRYDVSGPLETAFRLSKAWTTAQLRVLDDMGHGNGTSFPAAVTAALAELAG